MDNKVSMADHNIEDEKSRGLTGRELNQRWKVDAQQALYRENGTWYRLLDRFPGALFDANGYILFKTKLDYEQCERLQRGKELGVPHGIESIPGYIKIRSEVNREHRMSNPDLDAMIAEIVRRSVGHQIFEFQTIRAAIKGRPLPKSQSARKIFGGTHRDRHGDYAFHPGGGTEFQFNIGFESDNREIRHGIAFSLNRVGTSLGPNSPQS